ncbi:MAG: TrkH family potassium uptake protein [Armatimonadota bacterium]|nr:TrkH family potassium uptake protein [Armatimonadota bacterium]MDR7452294.1 TrkH family potassium uptake protein [Armatimonadota bacterium]MDR7467943.1 TrkH family potassium uptake protein [Armatimonadota bacterium]MDR7494785.1 TrkH family potassium uptake protein [Armatimonadota bacterium]MDR7499261.1 TrkH family potassium uptake protein [Armatimonadota bacterium]
MAQATVLEKRSPFARLELTPSQAIIAGFAAIILAGGLVLTLPVAAEDGQATPFLTALFTATSATCVTGLVVVDTADHWSTFGEIVVLLLIQLGGLGYMTVATLMAMAIGRRIGLRQRLVLQEAYNLYTVGGVVRFTRTVVLATLAIEGAGALLLLLRWGPELGWLRGAYYAVFHSVSAFNNAGFDLWGGFRSFTPFVGDLPVNLILALLIILGGLGFTVLVDLRRPERLTLHGKVVLATTAALILAGTVLILLLEFRNPATLGPLPGWQKVLAAFFQSVTPRTAGFNTLDMGRMLEPTLMLLIALMFIGASPGGTGGGIKTTTFIAPLAVILAMLRGRPDPELFWRRLPPVVVYKAVTIALVGLAFVVTMGTALSSTEGVDLIDALFEVTSAFGTVGLSTGLTPHLSTVGRIIVMITVFIGRVGLLTMAFALTRRQRQGYFRYPEERILIG